MEFSGWIIANLVTTLENKLFKRLGKSRIGIRFNTRRVLMVCNTKGGL